MSRQFLTPVRLPSGTSNPQGESAGALFFRSDIGRLVIFDGTNWLTLALDDFYTPYLDGGAPDGFSPTIDGGSPTDSIFSSNYDGGYIFETYDGGNPYTTTFFGGLADGGSYSTVYTQSDVADGGNVRQADILLGGFSTTTNFSDTIDGGIHSTSTFSSTTDGGTPGSF